MKYVWKYFGAVCLIVVLYVAVFSRNNEKSQSSISNIPEQMNLLLTKHNDDFYLSLFSISELRPYSILQFKENTDLYNGNWISPDVYLSNLDTKEREFLKTKISEYIHSKGDEFSEKVLEKMDFWCSNHSNFELIINHYGVSKEDIVKILKRLDGFKQLSEIQSKTGPDNETINTKLQNDELFFLAENIISSKSKKEQFMIFSEIYKELSLIVSN